MIQILVQIRDLTQVRNLRTDLVCVEQLADGDVDDRFVDDEQLGKLVHVESVLWFRNVTNAHQELPVRHKQQKPHQSGPVQSRTTCDNKNLLIIIKILWWKRVILTLNLLFGPNLISVCVMLDVHIYRRVYII